MGNGNKSHGSRSNKETQSPVLKVFREMMQKESHDAEKSNLLKSKPKKKVKKQYSGSRSKSDIKSESRSSGKRSKTGIKDERHAEFEDYSVNSSTKDAMGKKVPPSDETCSCVSCALRKVISSDYACFTCLAILFIISVVAAFLLIYRSIPICSKAKAPSDVDRLKRKIDLSSYQWNGGKQNGKRFDDETVHEAESNDLDGAGLQQLISAVDPGSELSKLLDNDKLNEIQSSYKLREFYKKLIEADIQIRKLKKNNEEENFIDKTENKYQTYQDRNKRSLNIMQKPLRMFHFYKNKFHKNNDDKITNNNINSKNDAPTNNPKVKKPRNIDTNRSKRLDNLTEPEGEKKKIFIAFNPKTRKSKCSHAPKDSKSHENQLKHPYYQNSERLDELLDKFLDKNMQEIITGPFQLDVFGEQKSKCKHPKIKAGVTTKESLIDTDFTKSEEFKVKSEFKSETDQVTNKDGDTKMTSIHDIFEDEFKEAEKKEEVTTQSFMAMSDTTMLYTHSDKKTTFIPEINRAPMVRKLLQLDEGTDQTEVLNPAGRTDDDEEDIAIDSHRTIKSISDDINKWQKNPTGVFNPNWKGPMPLYPDELSSMFKNEETDISKKVEFPVLSNETDAPIANIIDIPARRNDVLEPKNTVNRVGIPLSSSETDNYESNLNDVDYIQDYFRNKYERLAGLAQAYSDYGVFEGQKASEKKVDVKESSGPRVKLTIDGIKERVKNSAPEVYKKDTKRIAFEILPTTASRDDVEVPQFIKKHFKVVGNEQQECSPFSLSTDTKVIYTPYLPEIKTSRKPNEEGFIYTIGNKRTIKSVTPDDEEKGNDGDETKLSVTNYIDNAPFRMKREVDLESQNSKFDDINTSAVDESASKQPDVSNNMKVKGEVLINDTVNELSDIFMSLAKFFGALDGAFTNLNDNVVENISKSMSITPGNIQHQNDTADIIFPIYDSDMIENIGHRSRVLLSEEDFNITGNVEKRKVTLADKKLVNANAGASKNITMHNILITQNANAEQNSTKSVVKRNAEDSSIFWNDIYDDEYGVTVDHFENNLRDTNGMDKRDVNTKSKDWFRDKVRKISGNLKRSSNLPNGNTAAANSGNKKNYKDFLRLTSKPIPNNKRVSRGVKKNSGNTDFAALTANMKKICQKAAYDVKQSRRMAVRGNNKQEDMASSLMQQLVKLMTDLVDYQVQERTCKKLPPDLEKFLEWLTSPDSAEPTKENTKLGHRIDAYPERDSSQVTGTPQGESFTTGTSREMEDKLESRSKSFGTLQAVQSLMKDFDALNDDDKSKMTGVREYLENQMQYLEKILTPGTDINMYNTMEAIRYRRDTSHRNAQAIKNRRRTLKEKLENFKNRFKKPRTKDKNKTINIAEHTTVNKESNKDLKTKPKEAKVEKEFELDAKTVKEKKNLRDVYYKALEDAKKLTTVKVLTEMKMNRHFTTRP